MTRIYVKNCYHSSEQRRSAASWKWVRILKNFGLCKIPPFSAMSAISAQVVLHFRFYFAFWRTWGYARFLHPPLSLLKLLPKVSVKPATKICWYLLFLQTWPREHVCRKNPMRKAVFYFIFVFFQDVDRVLFSLIAFCWLSYQVVRGKTSHRIIVKG